MEVTPNLNVFWKLAPNKVIRRDADFTTESDTPMVFAITNGKKTTPLAMNQSSKRNEEIISRQGREIASPEDAFMKKHQLTDKK
ncbi:MAG: hypothetical protein ACLP29_00540 [Dissulfurispiraceae bacterium]